MQADSRRCLSLAAPAAAAAAPVRTREGEDKAGELGEAGEPSPPGLVGDGATAMLFRILCEKSPRFHSSKDDKLMHLRLGSPLVQVNVTPSPLSRKNPTLQECKVFLG